MWRGKYKLSTRGHYRAAVGFFFFIQGLVFSSWASRIPDIKNALALSDAQLGGALFFIPIGQLAAMALSGYLVSVYGSRKILTVGALLYPAVLVTLGFAANLFQLSIFLMLFGMAANLCNISVNTQGVGVERIYGRSIMGSFHGLWSLAGFTGGVLSTIFVGLDILPFYHFCLIYALAMVTVLLQRRNLLPRDGERNIALNTKAGRNVHFVDAGSGESVSRNDKPGNKIFVRPDGYILLLGAIAFGCLVCEGTMFEWSSVYFEQVLDPPRALVRLGYIAAMSAMATGRFAADHFINKFGVDRILIISGMVIFAGLIIVAAFPQIIPATVGFLLVGAGVSAVVPICYSMAGKSKKMLPGVALATVSTIGFFGFLLGPPVIGFVSQALNLRWAMAIIAFLGLFVTFLSLYLRKYLRSQQI